MSDADDRRAEFAEDCEDACIAIEREAFHCPDLKRALRDLHEQTVFWLISDTKCCVCGCAEDTPCDGGCWWIEDPDQLDRCSQCAGLPVPDRDSLATAGFTYLSGIIKKYRKAPLTRTAWDALADVCNSFDRFITSIGGSTTKATNRTKGTA